MDAKNKYTDLLNEGAQAERDAIRAYLKRRVSYYRRLADLPEIIVTLEEVLRWIDGRTARFAAREGGLEGRTKK